MKFQVIVPVTLAISSCFVGCTEISGGKPAAAKTASAAKKTDAQPVAASSAIKPAATATPVAAKPATPATPVAPAAPIPPPPLSPEAKAVVERLTQAVEPGTLQHEVSSSTGFPEAMASLQPGAAAPLVDEIDNSTQPPAKGLTADGNSTQLIERDWTGLVLVPIATSLSKAYTSDVRLLKVEAHPLNDGRVRIWTRIENVGRRALPAEVACSFRMKASPTPTSPYFYQLEVPGSSYRDVFFISPDGDLTSYTVLVRGDGVGH